MKTINLFLKSILITFFFLSTDINAQVSTIGLVGDYSFNGNANDISGLGNNGIVWGATLAAGKSGQPNTAYHFNGTTNYIEVPNSPSLNFDTAITLYALFKPEGFYNGPCQNNSLITKWNSNNGGEGYALQFTDNVYDLNCNSIDTNHSIALGISANNNSSGLGIQDYGFYIHTNQWYCLTFTQLRDTQKVYINGILYQAAHIFNQHIGNNNLSLLFGKNSLGIPSFTGIIDEIKIYNRALSDFEVSSLCSSTNTAIHENLNKQNFTFYPNPSKNGIFNLNGIFNDPSITFDVYNALGKLILEKQFKEGENIIVDLTSYPSGIYLAVIKAGNNIKTRKIVKSF